MTDIKELKERFMRVYDSLGEGAAQNSFATSLKIRGITQPVSWHIAYMEVKALDENNTRGSAKVPLNMRQPIGIDILNKLESEGAI